jgi:cystathionine gamma-synthase
VNPRIVSLLICPEDKQNGRILERNEARSSASAAAASVSLHIVLFPPDAFPVAKQFWQHSGMGISSRLAEHCLSTLPEETLRVRGPSPPPTPRFQTKIHNRHYSAKPRKSASPPTPPSPPKSSSRDEGLEPDQNVYVEERYGRNLPISYAASAKRALRRRIAGVLIRDNVSDCQGEPIAGDKNLKLGPSSRGIAEVSEDDVYLFPTGMSAIWSAHNLALAVRPVAKSVCFGYVLLLFL